MPGAVTFNGPVTVLVPSVRLMAFVKLDVTFVVPVLSETVPLSWFARPREVALPVAGTVNDEVPATVSTPVCDRL
jgi:hypothetical protein